MSWELKNGVYVRDGCYLEPKTPDQVAADSYALVGRLLRDKLPAYTNQPPLLLPLGRGGFKVFLYVSGELRTALESDIDYVPIKVNRYKKGEIGQEDEIQSDEQDVEQALKALKNYEECVVIDDIGDRFITIQHIASQLSGSGKRITVITPYVKPESNETDIKLENIYYVRPFWRRNIEDKAYLPWVVFPWEKDDFSKVPELWELLFPEMVRMQRRAEAEMEEPVSRT